MSDEVKWTPFNVEGENPELETVINVSDFEPPKPKKTHRPPQPQGPDGKFLRTKNTSKPYVRKKLRLKTVDDNKKESTVNVPTIQTDSSPPQLSLQTKIQVVMASLLGLSLLVQIALLVCALHFFV